MQRILLSSLICTGLIAQVDAAEHRLAFSKAAELEVFVEHPENQPWCSAALQLRFQGKGASTPANAESIMPKLGVLIGRECPAAAEVSWRSVAADGTDLAHGSASANAGWRLQIAQGYGVEAPVATATPPAAPPAAAPDATAAVEPVEAQSAPAAPIPEATPSPAQPALAATADAPSSPPTPAPTQTPAPPLAATPTLPTVQEPQVALTAGAPALPPSDPVSAAPADPAQPQTVSTQFTVYNWKPRSSMETLREATFNTPLTDQNGCIFDTNFNFKAEPAFIRSTSQKLECDAIGRVNGEGTFQIARTDGRALGTIRAVFLHGQAFSDGQPNFEIQKVTHDHLYAYIGSDAQLKVHYLIEISGHNNVWSLNAFRLLALTENEELFRDAASIDAVIQQGIALMTPLAGKRNHNTEFIALTRLDNQFTGNTFNDENRLYKVSLSRSWNKNDWRYNLQRATNYLFERDYQAAQAAKREQERLEQEQRFAAEQAERQRKLQLQQQSWAERSHLDRYQTLAKQAPLERRNQWIEEVDHALFDTSTYTYLIAGGEHELRQIVHIGGEQDGSWTVDYPYPASLSSSQTLGEGWYRVSGTVRLSPEQTDSDGFPLTLIDAHDAQACSDRQCLAGFDPLEIMRTELHDPQWSPSAAQALIERVERGELD